MVLTEASGEPVWLRVEDALAEVSGEPVGLEVKEALEEAVGEPEMLAKAVADELFSPLDDSESVTVAALVNDKLTVPLLAAVPVALGC